ncbi:MAG: PilZ domain-containing protein [Myxococcota bacterium]
MPIKKDVPTPDEPKANPKNTRHLRAPIEIRIELTQGLQSFTATSRNLALGGVSFESLQEFHVGDKINVLLYIPIKKELELLKASSEVVWTEDQQGSWMMGAAFRKFAPGDQKRLREWLLDCVRAQKEGRSIL